MTENLPDVPLDGLTVKEKLKVLGIDPIKKIVEIYNNATKCEELEGQLKIQLQAMKMLTQELENEKKGEKENPPAMQIFLPMGFNPDGSVTLPPAMQQKPVVIDIKPEVAESA